MDETLRYTAACVLSVLHGLRKIIQSFTEIVIETDWQRLASSQLETEASCGILSRFSEAGERVVSKAPSKEKYSDGGGGQMLEGFDWKERT